MSLLIWRSSQCGSSSMPAARSYSIALASFGAKRLSNPSARPFSRSYSAQLPKILLQGRTVAPFSAQLPRLVCRCP